VSYYIPFPFSFPQQLDGDALQEEQRAQQQFLRQRNREAKVQTDKEFYIGLRGIEDLAGRPDLEQDMLQIYQDGLMNLARGRRVTPQLITWWDSFLVFSKPTRKDFLTLLVVMASDNPTKAEDMILHALPAERALIDASAYVTLMCGYLQQRRMQEALDVVSAWQQAGLSAKDADPVLFRTQVFRCIIAIGDVSRSIGVDKESRSNIINLIDMFMDLYRAADVHLDMRTTAALIYATTMLRLRASASSYFALLVARKEPLDLDSYNVLYKADRWVRQERDRSLLQAAGASSGGGADVPSVWSTCYLQEMQRLQLNPPIGEIDSLLADKVGSKNGTNVVYDVWTRMAKKGLTPSRATLHLTAEIFAEAGDVPGAIR
jgi:pentatricopeptide repeat protein